MEIADHIWFGIFVAFSCVQLAIVYILILISVAFAGVGLVIVFLFENWVFQAVFGAWVVFALQQMHQKSTDKAGLFQKRYDQKLAAIQTFFGLVDKRIYASRAYLASLRALPPDNEWTAERERYRDVVREWNEKAPGVVVTMLTLLPARLCFQVERETFLPFSLMDAHLGRIRRLRTAGTIDPNVIASVHNILSELVSDSNVSLAEFLNLAKEEQKLIDRKPRISEENLPLLSLGYLVSSLFKAPVN